MVEEDVEDSAAGAVVKVVMEAVGNINHRSHPWCDWLESSTATRRIVMPLDPCPGPCTGNGSWLELGTPDS